VKGSKSCCCAINALKVRRFGLDEKLRAVNPEGIFNHSLHISVKKKQNPGRISCFCPRGMIGFQLFSDSRGLLPEMGNYFALNYFDTFCGWAV
jgi:hypothetical protein